MYTIRMLKILFSLNFFSILTSKGLSKYAIINAQTNGLSIFVKGLKESGSFINLNNSIEIIIRGSRLK
jgi:hypothetical protein